MISPVPENPTAARGEDRAAKGLRRGFRAWLERRPRHVGIFPLLTFTSNLSILVRVGIPLMRALEVLAAQETDPSLRRALKETAGEVARGNRLSEAMAEQPQAFSPLYIQMVLVGEISGTLDRTLETLARHLHRECDLERRVRGALVYPVFVLAACVLVMGGILGWVVPALLGTFTSLVAPGTPLPWPTRIVAALATLAGDPRCHLAAVALTLLLLLFARELLSDPAARVGMARLAYRCPGLGPLLWAADVARLFRTLGILVGAGVSLQACFHVIAQVTPNPWFSEAVDAVFSRVSGGEPIGQALEAVGTFPRLATNLVSAGEESGRLVEMLLKAADMLDEQVTLALEAFVKLLEPAALLGLGVALTLMLLALILPLQNVVAGLA